MVVHKTIITRYISMREQMTIRSLGDVNKIFVCKQSDIVFVFQGFGNSFSDYTALQRQNNTNVCI